MRSYLLGYAS